MTQKTHLINSTLYEYVSVMDLLIKCQIHQQRVTSPKKHGGIMKLMCYKA